MSLITKDEQDKCRKHKYQQQFQRELQNRVPEFQNRVSLMMEMLHEYFVHQLAPLMNMLPEDVDYPDSCYLWILKKIQILLPHFSVNIMICKLSA